MKLFMCYQDLAASHEERLPPTSTRPPPPSILPCWARCSS